MIGGGGYHQHAVTVPAPPKGRHFQWRHEDTSWWELRTVLLLRKCLFTVARFPPSGQEDGEDGEAGFGGGGDAAF